MSRMKLAFDVIEDVRSLADNLMIVGQSFSSLADRLQVVADAMMLDEPQTDNARDPSNIIEKAVQEKKDLSLEDVRAVLAEKSRKGHTVAVKELLIKYGANKLSDIDPVNYKSLIADAEVL